jgi:hypothetical protein
MAMTAKRDGDNIIIRPAIDNTQETTWHIELPLDELYELLDYKPLILTKEQYLNKHPEFSEYHWGYISTGSDDSETSTGIINCQDPTCECKTSDTEISIPCDTAKTIFKTVEQAKEYIATCMGIPEKYMGMSEAHRTHCCKKHGCKYGDSDCVVVLGEVKQEYPCEMCGLLEEGYFDN